MLRLIQEAAIINEKESHLPLAHSISHSQENDWSELKLPLLATVLALLGGPLRFVGWALPTIITTN
ncbi:hypothetical protein [Aerosakkonema funiforme]|uniref:Uncharacterized protein n=1 Tax=Aerosakkonema funiforme FACHB-1375 TaxID=2949571 RepID=A0A926VIF7_9CYAN|nr:hypothetical protein [Aerosakkonema funiforme]MBD2184399.1 hypothetical protein [Aerosakkonema funiforme FACHB-1375]